MFGSRIVVRFGSITTLVCGLPEYTEELRDGAMVVGVCFLPVYHEEEQRNHAVSLVAVFRS